MRYGLFTSLASGVVGPAPPGETDCRDCGKPAPLCAECDERQCEDCGGRSVSNPETGKYEYRCWDCRVGL